MNKRILITGGAGFIGSHLADELLQHGYYVRALDNLSEQVHGSNGQGGVPAYLDPEVELIVGDVRDADAVRRALEGVDAVFHFAAMVGVGQSMYQIDDYISVNDHGTAVLLQEIVNRDQALERLLVASSMSLYGEGRYCSADGEICEGRTRSVEQLKQGKWEMLDAHGRPMEPLPTPEDAAPNLTSIYALSKYDQEQMCLVTGRAYGIDTVGLRFFNTYGPRQALSNPYTGVLAIFASRLLNNKPALIYEDGNQQRDFVNVHDVARACRLALETPEAAGEVFNVGTGQRHTIREIAEDVTATLGKERIRPRITGKYRAGDIRHCFPDMSKARSILGYKPQVTLEEGLLELAAWLEGQIAYDRVDSAQAELAARGLTV